MRKLRLLNKELDYTAQQRMVDELRFIRQHKALMRLLFIWDEAKEASLPETLITTMPLADMPVNNVKLTPLDSTYAFEARSECTDYEVSMFNDMLLGGDYINYMSAIRAHYKRAASYGPIEEWVVFFLARNTKVRLRVKGHLAALHTNFMDESTKLIAKDSGVKVDETKLIFACKSSVYEELREYVSKELKN